MNQEKKFKIGLIFTLDYEIHGNGSGNFENWVYLPTSHMLNIFDRYGAKLTIMAEMGHYWAMKRYKELFIRDIYLFESQLKEAVERGHDVQLHFHPQWIDAKYENGSWNLDFSRKTVERLCHNYNEAYFHLKKGKDELQNLLTTVNPDYQCVCFRAGYFQMQPSENIIKALEDAGFLSDSSVSKGIKANDNFRVLDYSFAYSKYKPWKISYSEICKSDDNGRILEFPILTDSKNLINKIIYKFFKKKNKYNIRNLTSEGMNKYAKCKHAENTRLIFSKFKSILHKRWNYADFCLKDYTELIKYIKKIISICKSNNDYYLPIVLIGHSKDFFFANNLSLFLEACLNISEVEFTTYFDAIKKYTKRD